MFGLWVFFFFVYVCVCVCVCGDFVVFFDSFFLANKKTFINKNSWVHHRNFLQRKSGAPKSKPIPS